MALFFFFSVGPVCSSFSAEAGAMLQALRWVSPAPTSLPFLFSFPSFQLSLCPLLRLSFCLKLSDRSGRNFLLSLPLLRDYNGSPDTHFFLLSRTPLISFCTVKLRTLRWLFGDSLSLRPLVQVLGSYPASGVPWSAAMLPSLGRGWVTTTNWQQSAKINNAQ